MPYRSALVLALLPALAVGVAHAGSGPTISPGTYVLDAARTNLRVRIPMMGVSRANLELRALDGHLAYEAAGVRGSRVAMRIDPHAVNAAATPMNRAVSHYFEPDRYPVIRFTAGGYAADAEGRGQLQGELTFHGVTRPVILDVDLQTLPATGGGARLAFTGHGKIRRSEFGITAARPFASDTVDLAFKVEFVKK